MPIKRWQYMVANGLEDEDNYQLAADIILLNGLKSYVDIVDESLSRWKYLIVGFKDTAQ